MTLKAAPAVRTAVGAIVLAPEIGEYIDVDDRYVGCLVRHRGTQRDSGMVVDFRAVDM